MSYVHAQQVHPLVHCDINKRCILHKGHAIIFYTLKMHPIMMETLELCQENGKVEDDQVIQMPYKPVYDLSITLMCVFTRN